MRKLFLILILLFNVLITLAQSNWVTKSLGKELSVKFPKDPGSFVKEGKTIFGIVGKDYILVAALEHEAMGDYYSLAGLSLQEQEREISSFLDEEFVASTNNAQIIDSVKTVRVGTYIGKVATYTYIDTEGRYNIESRKLVFANNNLYTFSIIRYQESAFINYKNTFLNSVTVNVSGQVDEAIGSIDENGWELICTDIDVKNKYYLPLERNYSEDAFGLKKVWVKVKISKDSFIKNGKTTTYYKITQMQLLEIKCATNEYRTKTTVTYNAKGDVIDSNESEGDNFHDAVPGSVLDKVIEEVCY